MSAYPITTIIGTNKRDKLKGGDGNDFIKAKGGDDVLRSSRGDDTLIGGRGNDEFYWEYRTDLNDIQGNDYANGN